MDKRIVYPGAIPLDSDMLMPQRNAEVALGNVMAAAFGSNTIVDGLAVSATSPASMQLVVAPGRIVFTTTVDTLSTGFGTLPVDNTDPLVKIGINLAPVTLPVFAAPSANGQSQNYLIEAAFSEVDGTPVSIPYYNALNPSQPTAQTQNTVRSNTVALQVKAGTAGVTGSQSTPAPDTGYVGLWVVTVPYGATSLTSANVALYPGAPFVPAKLGPGFVPGFSNSAYYTSTGTSNFTVPPGVTRIFAAVWAPGGGGGAVSGAANLCGNAGGGGGYAEKTITGLAGGQIIPITIGAPGAGGLTGGVAALAGGTCSVGSYVSATGGNPGGNAAGSGSGQTGSGGNGSGGDLNIRGQSGGTFWLSGTTNVVSAGAGGTFGTPLGQSGLGSSNGGNGLFPGGGGSPGITESSTSQNGGTGGGGLIILRW